MINNPTLPSTFTCPHVAMLPFPCVLCPLCRKITEVALERGEVTVELIEKEKF